MIKLLVACGSTLSRHGLRETLSIEKDFVIVKETTSIDNTIHYAKKTDTDILLLCCHLLIEGGNNFIAKIKERIKKPKLVVFNAGFTLEQELQLVRKGVVGIIAANSPLKTLSKALKKVHAGEFWLRRELTRSLIGVSLDIPHKEKNLEDCNLPLTDRELEILSKIAAGYSNQEISSKLCICEATVKTHINNIYRKLKIKDRLQATFYAIKHNLFSR